MKYNHEKDMYSDVCKWLHQILESRFRDSKIEVHNLSEIHLARFISRQKIENLPPEWITWDIKVDVVGFVLRVNKPTLLAFVECKNSQLTLAHLSQILGYSRIVLPFLSFLLSPLGLSSSLSSLLQEYRRTDILEYYWEKGMIPRKIIVSKWNVESCNIDRNNIIGGSSL
ncbi:TPA: hypothetical protein ENS27_08910 [bacterium]|nr:hypothetical protein [bacterium]